ncbi:hypothetical protein HanOQP8_Chr03g0122431 [Helianthus annuus]|nr:hypothetical protein HanOQP8_Chr03g0122431 [Helianthus annuus]
MVFLSEARLERQNQYGRVLRLVPNNIKKHKSYLKLKRLMKLDLCHVTSFVSRKLSRQQKTN